jgi:alkylation response protein AidB-like acyl-CoA dehydrogenase
MDFTLCDEQRLLEDTVARFVRERYDADARRTAMAAPEGWSRAVWARLSALGLLGLPFAEDEGGTGAGPEEIMIVMEQLGRGLVVEPFLSTVVLCGGLIAKAGTLRQREAMQPRIAEGALTLALAHGEPGSRWNLADVTTRAEGKRSDFVLNGVKTGALFADSADTLIVSARLEGGRRQERGIALFLVARTAPGVVVRATPTFDGLRTAEVTLTDVVVPVDDVLGPLGLAFPKLEAAVDAATAALCAEAVGTMARLNELTLEHLKTRQQFGQPLGANQVLRHRMVDMTIACEEARSMMLLATMHAADPDPVARRRAVSAAKAQVGRAARIVGQGAVQLHGGMGVVMENATGQHFRRLTAIELTFGDTDHHLDRFAKAG